MHKRDQYKRGFRFLASSLVLAYETAIFAYMWYGTYKAYMPDPFHRKGHWAVIGLYALCMFFFTRTYGGHRIGHLRTIECCLSQCLAIICANIVGYIEIVMLTVTYHDVGPIVLITLGECLITSLFVVLITRLYNHLYPPHKMLVIYGDYSPKAMVEKMNQRKDRYNVTGLVSINELGIDNVVKMIPDYEAVLLCDLASGIRNKLLKFCFDESIRTYVTPKVSDIIMSGMDQIDMFDTPLFLARNQGLQPAERFIKRLTDIVISLIGIVIASPFMLIIATCIKVYDHGNVFYTQERLSLNGKRFNIIKFRSMRADSEKDGARLAMKNDSRVTPVGKVIRNLHLDELPQLFNVLKGDMSIVGPRPERPEIFEQYEDLVPEFVFRLKVKAGLTGYAQVYGRYNTVPYDKLKLDMIYIQHFSLVMDFKIMLMTVRILFQKENTEGVDSNQTTAIKGK